MALEIGRALRRARVARGMTLKDLADASVDRFRPTSVAGYERGERKISLVRFCELCRLLDVPPERVLGEIEALLRQGVIVRPLAGFGAPGAIRVTVGTPEENAFLDEALGRVGALSGGMA